MDLVNRSLSENNTTSKLRVAKSPGLSVGARGTAASALNGGGDSDSVGGAGNEVCWCGSAQRVLVGRGQVQVVGVNGSRVTYFRTASSSYGAWHLVHVSPALAPETRRKR